MRGLADVLGRERVAHDAIEWTAEANPESLTPEVATAWRRAGVNRLSLGAQSFQEPVLRWMGRLHGPDGPGQAVERARAAGLDDVSVDLIFGLPPSVERDWDADLARLLDLDVPHVSLYGLTAEAATPLGRSVAAGRVAMPPEERYAEEYLRAHELLSAAGYRAYEVSNFARPGHESRHNRAYWEGRAYLGLGNGAHGYLPPERRWNLRDWDAYARAADAGRLPLEDRESVSATSGRLEALWLALRTDRGLAPDEAATPAVRTLTEGWLRTGLALRDRGRVVLTPRGWLLLDRLAVELDAALDARGPVDQRH
jgi:oxygen-independent coproporphyrinogen-3 oxidase